MNAEAITARLTEGLRSEFEVYELDGRFVIGNPFAFDDGDGYPVVVERNGDGWLLTDDTAAAEHLSYDDVALTGNRREAMRTVARSFGFDLTAGLRLERRLGDTPPDIDAVFDLLQAIGQINALRLGGRHRTDTTLVGQVRAMITSLVPRPNRDFDGVTSWDEDGDYRPDVTLRPTAAHLPRILGYAVWSAYQANQATISAYHHREMEREELPVVIFEDDDGVGGKAGRQLDDVAAARFRGVSDTGAVADWLTEHGVPVTAS